MQPKKTDIILGTNIEVPISTISKRQDVQDLFGGPLKIENLYLNGAGYCCDLYAQLSKASARAAALYEEFTGDVLAENQGVAAAIHAHLVSIGLETDSVDRAELGMQADDCLAFEMDDDFAQGAIEKFGWKRL